MGATPVKTSSAIYPILELLLELPLVPKSPPRRSKAWGWDRSPSIVTCPSGAKSGQTENWAQTLALWKELPGSLKRQMTGRPEKAFLTTEGDGYYSPMISSLRFVFATGTEHV